MVLAHGGEQTRHAWKRTSAELIATRPRASLATLERVVAAGVTSDHESVSGEQLLERVRLGLWTMIRQSSLRPDASQIASVLAGSAQDASRLLLTADGVDPEDLEHGHLDAAVRAVIGAGVPAESAVRMATLNPATYLGLDAHLGSIAPGRCADLVAVDSLERFEPLLVLADGRLVTDTNVSGGNVPWRGMALEYRRADLDEDTLAGACRRGPVLRLDGVVARAASQDELETEPWRYAALIRRDGSAITGVRILGLECAEVASTQTGYRDVLVLGARPGAMLEAYTRVIAAGGGIATPEQMLPLPVLGAYSDEPVPKIAEMSRAVTRSAGWHPDQAPLKWVTLFLTEAVMPGCALTPDGVFDVRAARIIAPAEPLPESGSKLGVRGA